MSNKVNDILAEMAYEQQKEAEQEELTFEEAQILESAERAGEEALNAAGR